MFDTNLLTCWLFLFAVYKLKMTDSLIQRSPFIEMIGFNERRENDVYNVLDILLNP